MVYVLFDCPKDTHRIYCGVFESYEKAEEGKERLLKEEQDLGITGSDYVIFPVRLNSLGV